MSSTTIDTIDDCLLEMRVAADEMQSDLIDVAGHLQRMPCAGNPKSLPPIRNNPIPGLVDAIRASLDRLETIDQLYSAFTD